MILFFSLIPWIRRCAHLALDGIITLADALLRTGHYPAVRNTPIDWGLADCGTYLVYGMVGLVRRSVISGSGIAQGLITSVRGWDGLPTVSRLGV